MREIKFRAWDIDDKEMVEVSALDFSNWKIISLNYPNGKKYPDEDYWDRIRFMQYTGLKDKNWKEIYESDLLEYPDSYVWTDEASIAKIIYGENMRLEWVWVDCYIDYNSFENCEIIGNIYENPNLLNND